MRWAIFCLSLAYCAFEAAFAEYGDADHTETGDASKGVPQLGYCELKMKPLTKHAQNVIKAEHKKSTNTDSKHCRNVCLYQSSQAFKKHYDESYTQIGTCYSKSLETKNSVNDQECCNQAVVALKKSIKTDVATAQGCMTKCDQPGADCHKKNENLDTDGRMKTKNHGAQTETIQQMLTYATGPESRL